MMSDRTPDPSAGINSELLLRHPRPQRILVVADGSLDFGSSHYGLGELVSVLQAEGHAINTAHRYGLGDNSIEGIFNFAKCGKAVTLENYDQIWLFGFSATPLQEAERKIIAQFMENGGGVFATGGHGLLGSGMGANLPRIRAMRRWTASPIFDENSLDVVLKRNSDATIQQDKDLPDTPEKISPIFLTSGGDQFLMPSWSPHPILRHKLGIIETLPCHSLATECLEPLAIADVSFAGVEEWPADATKSTYRPSPTVVAKSINGNQHWGTVSVYDGDCANVGRIVCDSSWRRFINLNINSTFAEEDLAATKLVHPPHKNKVHPKLPQYYLNIARWLAPQDKRECWNWLLSTLARADLNSLGLHTHQSSDKEWGPMIRTGALLEDFLARQHGPGTAEELVAEFLTIADSASALKNMFKMRTPGEILKQSEIAQNTLLLPRHLVRRALLGSVANTLLHTFSINETAAYAEKKPTEQSNLMQMAVTSGVRKAEEAIADFMHAALNSTRHFIKQLNEECLAAQSELEHISA